MIDLVLPKAHQGLLYKVIANTTRVGRWSEHFATFESASKHFFDIWSGANIESIELSVQQPNGNWWCILKYTPLTSH